MLQVEADRRDIRDGRAGDVGDSVQLERLPHLPVDACTEQTGMESQLPAVPECRAHMRDVLAYSSQ